MRWLEPTARERAVCTSVAAKSFSGSSRQHRVISATVSSVIALTTMWIFGFFSSKSVRISFSWPLLPPIKAWVGTGSASMAAGAFPYTVSTLGVRNFFLFLRISSTASAFCSMAYTVPRCARRAASTDTEPVPAPISYSTLSSVICSRDSDRIRTSSFVMGTSPRIHASSGMEAAG